MGKIYHKKNIYITALDYYIKALHYYTINKI